MNQFFWACFTILISSFVQAEPSYCNPDKFIIQARNGTANVSQEGLLRLHGFKVGKVHLFGLGVGRSNPESIKKLALETSNNQNISQDNYCTWYLNSKTNTSEAAIAFNHHYVPAPFVVINGPNDEWTRFIDSKIPKFDSFTQDNLIQDYVDILSSSFGVGPGSFLYCAQKYHYIALGCNSQMQRGPTVFGSLLAYSGCTAESATKIVNSLWDHLNINEIHNFSDVNEEARFAIIEKFHDLGQQNPIVSLRLQKLFTQDAK